MSDLLANDVRKHFEKTFATITGIVDAFPEDKWLQAHIGELNKMLIENGMSDVWIAR